MKQLFTKDQVLESALEYFNGDDLAASVWTDKYCLKDSESNYYEKTPDDMHRRLAREFARIESNYPNPLSEQEIFELLKDFRYVVPQGGPMAGIGNDFVVTSVSNCFVIGNEGPSDSYGGIMKIDQEQVQLMKRRGGVGHDLSHLRAKGLVANGAKLKGDTGMTLYMNRYSSSTREVAQDNRRGALMLSTSIKHPDSEEFIDMKMDTSKVTGANISVKIDDDFMNAVEHNISYTQQFPVDSESPLMTKEIKATSLWNKIIHNAWKSAEPGILFWDTVLRESPTAGYGESWKPVSTNPCFTGDTLILTNNGYVEISSLVWSKFADIVELPVFVNEKGENVLGRVWSNGVKDVVKLTFEDGSTIRCTPDHVFKLDDDSERKAIDLLNKNVKSFLNNKTSKTVIDVSAAGSEEVFDFNLISDTHWGVIEGVIAHNCGEIPLCPYDSCRLIALNLFSYVENPFSKDSYFNWELFKSHVKKAQRIMDDLIDIEVEKIDKIIAKIKNDPESQEIKQIEITLWNRIREKAVDGRRTGLGVTAEGDMLAALNLKYGTAEATEFAADVHRMLAISAYESSIDLAEERGCFKMWNFDKDIVSTFVQRIYEELSQRYQDKLIKYGRRNIALLTIAPTGTTSLMTQTSSGIEPGFLPFYKRRRKTEEESKCVFKDEVGDMWEEFFVIHHKFKIWYEVNNIGETGIEKIDIEQLTEDELNTVFKLSPYYGATSNDIDYVEKVRMQGEIQKWVDHSISVTVNMPNDVTEHTVSEVYFKAWKFGCKGVTVYRDGSRSGVLISSEDKKKNDEIEYRSAPKRPETLNVDIYSKTALKRNWTLIVGLLNSKPYEIFAFEQALTDFPKDITQGTLTKVAKKHYRLVGIKNGKEYVIDNLISFMNDDEQYQTTRYSLELRHGIDPKFIVDDIDKSSFVTSFRKVIGRTLKNYIKDGEVAGSCPNCKGKLRYADGCKTCPSCGYSQCG